jgi:PQQ-dependent catabolism-associated CXXCW motif protein
MIARLMSAVVVLAGAGTAALAQGTGPFSPMPRGQQQMPMGQQQVPMGQQQVPMGQQQMPMGMSPQMQQMVQQAMMYETQNWGVPPTDQLNLTQVHGPTPNSIPGARVVSTLEMMQAVQSGQRLVVVDVLGGQHQVIPGAMVLPDAGLGQGFNDGAQQQLGQILAQATGGNPSAPVVFYCLGPQCWLSYNAALRAVRLGYTNVGWYRGGIEVWAALGLPTQQPGTQPLPIQKPMPPPMQQPITQPMMQQPMMQQPMMQPAMPPLPPAFPTQ